MHNTKNEQSGATLLLSIAEHLAGQVSPPLTKDELIALLKTIKVPRTLARNLWLRRRTRLGIERAADISNFYVVLRTLRLNERVSLEGGMVSLSPGFVDSLSLALDQATDFTNIPAWMDQTSPFRTQVEFEASLEAALAAIRP